ncbi:MAG: cotSA [Rickettsiaceae bacterium]|jgi:glycosyltransferase involved in cell wall biosynthesis|nr:cotSA [Rickettsiaceae bacterium]
MNKNPKVIMQVLPALNSGGVERGVIDVSKAVALAGFGSIVVSSGGPMTGQLRSSKVKHITLPLASKNPFKIYSNIKKLENIIIENNVDLVHIRSRSPAWSAYFACKKTGCKMVSTVHGPYSVNLFGKRHSRLKLLYNSVMLKPKYIIAVSEFIKNYISRNYFHKVNLGEKQIKVIHRGVDLGYFSKSKIPTTRVVQLIKKWDLPDDKQIIMLPGRITGWKGHEFLIAALAKVKNPNFFCIMVGSLRGHEKFAKKLEAEIKKNNLEGKIELVGETNDMPAAYLVSDIVISASTRPEAFGRVAIEAGAMGRIVIATNIGGSLETIIDGKTGFLVDVNNVDDLAKKIDQALSMEESKKQEICQNATKHIAENFSNQKMLDSTIEFYKEILSSEF